MINKRNLLKKYKKYIEYIQKDGEMGFENDYWCYLKTPYETDYNTSSIHDTLENIQSELEEISKTYDEIKPEIARLIIGCKDAYENNDLDSASKFWNMIYDNYSSDNNTSKRERIIKTMQLEQIMELFSDEEVYAITDYGREKAYREMGYIEENTEDNEEVEP